MSTLRLTTTHILQMLADKEFFEAVPAFLFMEENAAATLRQWDEYLANPGRKECCGQTEKAVDVLVGRFARMVLRLGDITSGCAPLKAYLEKRMQSKCESVTMVYAGPAGDPQEFAF